METIILFPVMHRGTEQILIKCSNIKIVNDAIRKIPKAKWSETHNSWYVPLNKDSYTFTHQALHQLATLNTDELRKHLLKKKMSDK